MGNSVNKVASAATGGLIGGGAGGAAFGPAGALIGGAAMAKNGWSSGVAGAAGGTTAAGRPEWSLSGADGKLRSDLLLGNEMPQAVGQSQDVLNRQIANATAVGPSQSAQYLQEANTRSLNNNLDNAEAGGRGQMAAMSSQLAMRGGLDAGARERMAKNVGMNTMMGKQKMMNDSAGANLEILAKDEAQKQAQLQALPASLLAQAGFQQGNKQFDIQNTLGTVGGKYKEDMSAWAALNSAKEQAAAAGKDKGMLGLGILGL